MQACRLAWLQARLVTGGTEAREVHGMASDRQTKIAFELRDEAVHAAFAQIYKAVA